MAGCLPSYTAVRSSSVPARRKDFIREIINSVASAMFIATAALVALSGNLRPYTRIYTAIDAYPGGGYP